DHAVEVLVDDAPVELLDVKIQFVFQLGCFDVAGANINSLDRLAPIKVNAVLTQQGFKADGRFVVDQPVVRYRLAIGVDVYGLAEYLGGMLGRSGGQPNPNGVEIIQNPAVAGDIL